MAATKTLFRPVGLVEMGLIYRAELRGFPPRLPEQPIFYPVLNQPYADQIAREWNAPKEPHHAGFVTRFEVDGEYVARFEEHVVGASIHRELWVPAETLEDFNRHIAAPIQVVSAFYGPGYRGPEPKASILQGVPIEGQLALLFEVQASNDLDFLMELAVNREVIELNHAWWVWTPASTLGLDETRKAAALRGLARAWSRSFPGTPLIGRAGPL